MSDYLAQLVAFWNSQEIGPASSRPSVNDIEAWERQHGVRLPQDLREYFRRVNGTHNGEHLEFGNDLTTFLPLHAVVPESEWSKREGRPGHFVIVDYCVSCYWWTALLTSEAQETTSIFLGRHRVARSLKDFVSLYLAGSKQIHNLDGNGWPP